MGGQARRAGWWLFLGGALVGLAFLAKMLQAFLVLPALILVYVVFAGVAWRHRLLHLLGAFAGMRFAPYAVLYRRLVAPRLAPPTETEPAAPVRFAQGGGFAFAVVGAAGYLAGLTTLGTLATAAALAAAFLNAAFGLCLGCLLYLRGRLLVHRLTHPLTDKGVNA